jgi:hypothetical protein
MLFRAGCNIGEIVTITGHSLRRAQEILDKYPTRTSQLAESAIAKFENVLETDFAKRPANADCEHKLLARPKRFELLRSLVLRLGPSSNETKGLYTGPRDGG